MQAHTLPSSTKRQKQFFYLSLGLTGLFIFILPVLLMIKITAFISISLIYFLMFYMRGEETIQLERINDDIWCITGDSGKIIRGHLQGKSISTSLFCIIIVKSPEKWFSTKVLVFNDALPEMQYHHLRLQLKGLLP